MGGVQRVGARAVRMMSRLLMMTGSVMRGGFLVVLHGVFVMLGGLGMMAMGRMMVVRRFLSHAYSPFFLSVSRVRCPRLLSPTIPTPNKERFPL
jgi:hypothetical protein